MTLTATADGPSPGNPEPAGQAWYVDDDCQAAEGWESSTNNRGELTTVLGFLRVTKAAGLAGRELLIQYNSQYVINSLTEWRHGWKKRGQCKADGKPVLNSDLVKNLDAAFAGHTIRFEWVRGHVSHPMDEAANSQTRGAATTFQQGRPVSARPGWARDGRAPGNREAWQAPSATSSNTPAAPQTDALS